MVNQWHPLSYTVTGFVQLSRKLSTGGLAHFESTYYTTQLRGLGICICAQPLAQGVPHLLEMRENEVASPASVFGHDSWRLPTQLMLDAKRIFETEVP